MPDSTQPHVLATLLHLEGSSFRRPGARMTIQPDGTWAGALSGGCLEGDLAEQARAVFADRQPRLVSYDSTREEDILWGFGTGCRGLLHILLEHSGSDELALYALASGRCRRDETRGILVTSVTGESGGVPHLRRLFLPAVGTHFLPVDLPGLFPDAAVALGRFRAALYSESRYSLKPYHAALPGSFLLLEALQPPPKLLIFGSGPDIPPLLAQCGLLGWDTLVIDPRPGGASPLPYASLTPVLSWDGASDLPLAEDTLAIVMNHHFERDLQALRLLLPHRPAYLALLGPRRRREELLAKLAAEGLSPAARAAISRLYNPAGLDLGAETPAEIALAIAAELQAVLTSSQPAHLSTRTGPLHPASR